ncbi:MAG TPA: hypothetical protein VLJ42_13725 [Solirubrobacteraceae bacterium]|nr:hypothetical protein [Solirubrobacteraceae bacterium]
MARKKDSAKESQQASGAEAADGKPSIAAHPRAVAQIKRAKGWGGLAGFLIGGYLSLPTHTVADAGFHALVAGVVCYVAAWAASVFAWRYLVVMELKGREYELLAAQTARRAGPEPPEQPGTRTQAAS